MVYDSVGKDTFIGSLDCLRPRGLMVTYGNASGPVPPMAPLELTKRGSLFLTRPTLFHYIPTRASLVRAASEMFDLVAKSVISVQIGQSYPLQEAARAHVDLEARRTTGSTVLLPNSLGNRRPVRLPLDALAPGADRRIRREIEAAFMRDVRVRIQRDVRQRVLPRRQVLAVAQRFFEHVERRVAVLLLLHQFLAELRARLAELHPEAQRRDVRLEVVLLEAHPLPHARALERIGGNQRASLRRGTQ